jgi:hypothetical protein
VLKKWVYQLLMVQQRSELRHVKVRYYVDQAAGSTACWLLPRLQNEARTALMHQNMQTSAVHKRKLESQLQVLAVLQ